MDQKKVAARICAARKARGMTQEELAARAELSLTHIGVIERGLKTPNLNSFVAIANALEISADALLQDVVDKSCESASTELSRLISKQSPEMQRKIYRAVRALVE
ncbi:MAG: helix-turn-helix transcriptional regulator [Oscillospiraceae bacterium]|nr:helix-turn-helix transcriptional regulator [Oscillospiraceae bacterium]MBR6095805.1 helix-turn-helix transcriptional regulator [Oscillospiraceae bacterium]